MSYRIHPKCKEALRAFVLEALDRALEGLEKEPTLRQFGGVTLDFRAANEAGVDLQVKLTTPIIGEEVS
jgi:hypothetical protein